MPNSFYTYILNIYDLVWFWVQKEFKTRYVWVGMVIDWELYKKLELFILPAGIWTSHNPSNRIRHIKFSGILRYERIPKNRLDNHNILLIIKKKLHSPPTASLLRAKIPLMSVLFMTVNYLMVRFHLSWRFGKYEVSSLPGLMWPGVVAPDSALSMVEIELNCVLMLNWIPWNRTVFDIWTVYWC